MRWRAVAPALMLTLVAVGCGDPTSAPHASVADTTTIAPTTTTAPVGPAAVHFTHAQLAAALPNPSQLGWLPVGTTSSDDQDLTTSLSGRDCNGATSRVASNEASATNRAFQPATASGAEGPLAVVTFYDVNDTATATSYVDMVRTLVKCPVATKPKVTVGVLLSGTPACDDALAVLEHQPAGDTVDGWCRVGNLVAWFRLYPAGNAPTADQATRTATVVGDQLRSLM